MLLTELFDKVDASNWKWTYTAFNYAKASFIVGTVKYEFIADGDTTEPGLWELTFRAVTRNEDYGFGLTKTGNSQKVMSTVISIINDFLNNRKYKVEVITFSAKEDSRKKLYAKMIHRLVPTWKMSFRPGNDYGSEEFVLVSPKKDTI